MYRWIVGSSLVALLVACGAPTPATPTPRPVPTLARPTAALLSPAEQAYRDDARTLVANMGTQLEDVGTALTTGVGRELIRSLAGRVRSTQTKLAAMDVPSSQRPYHAALIAATGRCDAAMGDLLAAIDPALRTPSQSKLSAANAGLVACRAALARLP